MKTIAYLTVTGLALVQGAHIRGKSTSGSPGITGADVPATGDANTYDPAMTTGDSDTMDHSGATGASDATITDPLDTGMPATSYANDPAMMGTHAGHHGATYGTAMPSHDETTGHHGATYGTAMPSYASTVAPAVTYGTAMPSYASTVAPAVSDASMNYHASTVAPAVSDATAAPLATVAATVAPSTVAPTVATVNSDCVWSNIVAHCNKKTNKANRKACKRNRGKNCKNTGSPIK